MTVLVDGSLVGSRAATAADIDYMLSHAASDGHGGTILHLPGAGDYNVTLVGVDPGSLHSSDFLAG